MRLAVQPAANRWVVLSPACDFTFHRASESGQVSVEAVFPAKPTPESGVNVGELLVKTAEGTWGSMFFLWAALTVQLSGIWGLINRSFTWDYQGDHQTR